MKPKKALDALAALAQESRLAVFLLLLEHENGLPAGDIARELDIPLTTMSFHLSQLKNAGLIKAKKEGRFVIYSASKKRVKRLAAFITGKDKELDKKYQL